MCSQGLHDEAFVLVDPNGKADVFLPASFLTSAGILYSNSAQASPATLFLEDEFTTLDPRQQVQTEGIRGACGTATNLQNNPSVSHVIPAAQVLENFKPQTRVIVMTARCFVFAGRTGEHKSWRLLSTQRQDAGHEVSVVDLSQERWLTSELSGCPCRMPVSI